MGIFSCQYLKKNQQDHQNIQKALHEDNTSENNDNDFSFQSNDAKSYLEDGSTGSDSKMDNKVTTLMNITTPVRRIRKTVGNKHSKKKQKEEVKIMVQKVNW